MRESRGEEEEGGCGVSFKSKDQMRPVFPPVTETERAQRCWHRANNKWTQGLKGRKYQSLFDVDGLGFVLQTYRAARRKDQRKGKRRQCGI